MKVILFLVVVLSALASGQFNNVHRFGSSRPSRPTFNQFRNNNDAQYRDSNDGQYRGGEDGQYRPEIYTRTDNNEGRYVPDDSGKYVHMDQPYDGGYGDKGNRGGFYSGDNDRYQHIEGPRGSGAAPYKSPGRATFKPTGFTSFRPSEATTPKYGGFSTFVNVPKKITTSAPAPKFNYNVNNNSNKNYGAQQSAASRFRTYGNEGGWRILRQDKEIDPVSYSYAYETENKIIGEEVGRLQNSGGQDEGVRTSGFYEYEGDDGKKYRVDYTADENGFVPKGAHIPDGIEQAVEFLAKSAKY